MYIFLHIPVYFFTLLNTKGKNKHRGALLEAAVKDSPVNITQMVKRMGIARGTYYNHKNDPNLPLELLARYGKVLKYDFAQDLPEMQQETLEEPDSAYALPKTLEEAIAQRDYWRDKYYQLMERFHEVVLRASTKA